MTPLVLRTALLVCAIVLFLLGAFDLGRPRVSLIALGLAALAAAFLLGG